MFMHRPLDGELPLLPQSAAHRTRPNERQDAREDVAELAPAPRVDEPPGSLHRVLEGLRGPNQVLGSRCFNIKHRAHLRDDLAARVGWQISKRATVHGQTLCPSCCIRPHLAPLCVNEP
jgi:hypothetical protein